MRRFFYVVLILAAVFAYAPAAIGSECQVGVEAALRGDYEMAVRVWRPLAEEGAIESQVYLGIAYSNSTELSKLRCSSVSFIRAYPNGRAAGQMDFGSAVPQDLAEAEKWFRRAAEQGLFNAKMYMKEVSVFRNSQDMANQGDVIAQLNLGVISANTHVMCSWCFFRIFSQDYTEAVSWFRRAAEQGNATAQFNLAVMYQQGQGVPQDLPKAVKLYRQAAAQGDARAQMNLGLMHANGHGMAQDYGEAKKWLHLTALQGNTNAWLLLGALKILGVSLPHPYIRASTWSEIEHVIEAE